MGKSQDLVFYSYIVMVIGYLISQVNWLFIENATIAKISWGVLLIGIIVNLGIRIYQKSQGEKLEEDSVIESLITIISFPIILLCLLIITFAVILKHFLS